MKHPTRPREVLHNTELFVPKCHQCQFTRLHSSDSLRHTWDISKRQGRNMSTQGHPYLASSGTRAARHPFQSSSTLEGKRVPRSASKKVWTHHKGIGIKARNTEKTADCICNAKLIRILMTSTLLSLKKNQLQQPAELFTFSKKNNFHKFNHFTYTDKAAKGTPLRKHDLIKYR